MLVHLFFSRMQFQLIYIQYEAFDTFEIIIFFSRQICNTKENEENEYNNFVCFIFVLSNDMYKNIYIEINMIYEMESLSFIVISNSGIDAFPAESIFLHSLSLKFLMYFIRFTHIFLLHFFSINGFHVIDSIRNLLVLFVNRSIFICYRRCIARAQMSCGE